jgi:hypothetical protein
MSKKRFRLSENDTVKATISGNGKLLASLYDSGFSTKDAVFHALCRKVPYYAGKAVECHISVPEKEISTYFTKKVNR